MKILAIIPARGGSKSVPRKNIVNVGGKPLLAWTIEASLNSKYITKTVVSSEDKEILKISEKYGADVVIRPMKYAQDDTLITPVIKNCLSQLMKENKKFDILILLQPTSPLRNSSDIDAAFKMFIKKKAKALISGYEPQKTPYKSFKVTKKGWLRSIINSKTAFLNRQQLPKTFYPNGAIYIIYVKEFLKLQNLFSSKTLPFLMSMEKSTDVDSGKDIKKVNMLLKKPEVIKKLFTIDLVRKKPLPV